MRAISELDNLIDNYWSKGVHDDDFRAFIVNKQANMLNARPGILGERGGASRLLKGVLLVIWDSFYQL